MGMDKLYSFKKWKNSEKILEDHDLYVYPRVSSSNQEPELLKHEKVHLVDAPLMEISSTFIRNAIKNDKNIRPLMPYKAWKYLDEMNFYK